MQRVSLVGNERMSGKRFHLAADALLAGAGAALAAEPAGVSEGNSVNGTLCGARKSGPRWPQPAIKSVAIVSVPPVRTRFAQRPKIRVEKIIIGL